MQRVNQCLDFEYNLWVSHVFTQSALKDFLMHVVIVGFGNIGFRHLQGLSKSRHVTQVDILDTSSTARNAFREAANPINDLKGKLEMNFWADLKDMVGTGLTADLVIVSTPAEKRYELFSALLKSIEAKYWLLEKPLSQSNTALDRIVETSNGHNVWVNHSRRAMPWHQEIKSRISIGSSLHLEVKSPKIGFATNMCHYVDLVNFWTEELPKSVDTSNLDQFWSPTKRKGFFDVEGEMTVLFNGGSTLTASSKEEHKQDTIEGILHGFDNPFIIDEDEGKAYFASNEIISGSVLYQSELTGLIADSLMDNGTCSLPTLGVAAKCYDPIIRALWSQWQKVHNDKELTEIPIT